MSEHELRADHGHHALPGPTGRSRRSTTDGVAALRASPGLAAYLQRSVDPALRELVRLRASIVGGADDAVDVHGHGALVTGETPSRLFAVAAWRDSPVFTPAERAALALADSVAVLGGGGIPDDVWNEAAAHFEPDVLIDLVGVIAMVDLGNRSPVPLRATPAGAALSAATPAGAAAA